MKIFKPHFWYIKSQRNGVLFLIILIIGLQVVYFFVDFSSNELISCDDKEVVRFDRQLDSLKIIKRSNKKFKLYPFNPNYLTDYKGYQLGLSLSELNRLHQFRKRNKFINSIKDFKKVTKVSDSLLDKISPYFKFPDWVVKQQKRVKSTSVYNKNNLLKSSSYLKKEVSTNNVNLAKAEDFAFIKGIGVKLSERIVKYRAKLQGFSYEVQLYEVWGIESGVIKELLKVFVIMDKPLINKVNVNTAGFKEVLKTPYVDYDLCKKIFDYRDEVAELQNISELKNIEGFPVNKYERIVLYLDAN